MVLRRRRESLSGSPQKHAQQSVQIVQRSEVAQSASRASSAEAELTRGVPEAPLGRLLRLPSQGLLAEQK